MTIPKKVLIYEVGPRDGLQNEKKTIPTNIKVELINKLSECNFKNIEVGSFVSPRWVPQMADSNKVLERIKKKPGIKYPVLIPNLKGFQDAIKNKADTICVFVTASEKFSMKNTNCTVKEALKRVEEIVNEAKKYKLKVRGYISCVLGCPYEGKVSYKKTANIAKFLDQIGCYEISLGDTIGIGTPSESVLMIKEVIKKVNLNKIAVHFHDTYGQALANLYAVLQLGVSTIDSSVGGLGGCPYAKGASGNVATEDVLYMLNGMKIKTGVKFDMLLKTSYFINKYLERKSFSRVSLALSQ
jgi:isopropylmalate/homocitrate/citramalate synthase